MVFVYDAELKVRFDRNDLAVYDYPGLNAVNFLINDTLVMFAGQVFFNYSVDEFSFL